MYVPFKPFLIKPKLKAVTVHIENTVFAKRANHQEFGRNGRYLRQKLENIWTVFPVDIYTLVWKRTRCLTQRHKTMTWLTPLQRSYMLSCIVILFLGDTYGDACIEDFDGDGVHDKEDACPVNPRITRTDFSLYHTLAIDPESTKQERPIWKVNKKVIWHNLVKEILEEDGICGWENSKRMFELFNVLSSIEKRASIWSKITSCFYHNRLMLNSFPVSYLFLEGGEDPGNEVDPRWWNTTLRHPLSKMASVWFFLID